MNGELQREKYFDSVIHLCGACLILSSRTKMFYYTNIVNSLVSLAFHLAMSTLITYKVVMAYCTLEFYCYLMVLVIVFSITRIRVQELRVLVSSALALGVENESIVGAISTNGDHWVGFWSKGTNTLVAARDVEFRKGPLWRKVLGQEAHGQSTKVIAYFKILQLISTSWHTRSVGSFWNLQPRKCALCRGHWPRTIGMNQRWNSNCLRCEKWDCLRFHSSPVNKFLPINCCWLCASP